MKSFRAEVINVDFNKSWDDFLKQRVRGGEDWTGGRCEGDRGCRRDNKSINTKPEK